MEQFFNKISSYNIFNCLMPGVVFSVLASDVIHYPVEPQDVISRLFLYYFVGLIIGRFGSLIVEPILRWRIRFAPYENYIAGSRKDDKIELLSEVNNTYRAMCAMAGVLVLMRLYLKAHAHGGLFSPGGWVPIVGMLLLFVVFFLAYRKQSKYIISRIEVAMR